MAALKPGRIPQRWEDVTPQWMTAAIASRCPGAVVSDVALLFQDDGSNRRARFGLSYAKGTGPARVFLKAHAAKNRWVHFRNGNLYNEARLFASGVTLPIEHPAVYYATIDRLRLDFLLVMEDITERNADPRDATRPLTPEQVANGLRGLAALHSRFWNFSGRTEPRLRWMQTWKVTSGFLMGLRLFVSNGLVRGGDDLPAEVVACGAERILDFWSRYVASLTKRSVTLLHSDLHVGNTYVLPDNDVGLLDWQVVRRGEWSQDVGSFIMGALTIEDRRTHERELLAIYRDALALPAGASLSADEAWTRYRASPAYGLAVWLSTLGSDGYQTREISLALSQRFAAAFQDLDTMAVLDD